MKTSRRSDSSLLPVFRAPLFIAVMCVVGLMSALLGDDIWDALSWLMLGAPVAVICWYVMRPARPKKGR